MCLPKQSLLSTIVYAYNLIAESTSVGETHKSFVPWGGSGLGECLSVVFEKVGDQSAVSNVSCGDVVSRSLLLFSILHVVHLRVIPSWSSIRLR